MNPFGTRVLIYTVGHSTRTLEDFIGILEAYSIAKLVDIRTIPRSRHNPQFNQETLEGGLAGVKIAYVHMSGLGGLRHPRPDSKNAGWHNASFRGFADYMQTEEFDARLRDLIDLAKDERTAIMCAEALPWRCHRSLIADALLVRGIRVEHILSPTNSREHELTPWALVEDMRLSYPPPGQRRKKYDLHL
jgi:uncharacterized protein (DUF488 family)